MKSAISSVNFYVATGPVECCDRCSQGIRNVFVVNYKDGLSEKYGMECINRILDSAPSLSKLFQKNAKLLRKYQEWLAILSGPVDQMPRGHEYFGSGLYMIAGRDGKDICFKRFFFHPVFDVEKNQSGEHYVQSNADEFSSKSLREIEEGKSLLSAEIQRLESFLAKVLRSGVLNAS